MAKSQYPDDQKSSRTDDQWDTQETFQFLQSLVGIRNVVIDSGGNAQSK